MPEQYCLPLQQQQLRFWEQNADHRNQQFCWNQIYGEYFRTKAMLLSIPWYQPFHWRFHQLNRQCTVVCSSCRFSTKPEQPARWQISHQFSLFGYLLHSMSIEGKVFQWRLIVELNLNRIWLSFEWCGIELLLLTDDELWLHLAHFLVNFWESKLKRKHHKVEFNWVIEEEV